jgi:WD40 repeat protein
VFSPNGQNLATGHYDGEIRIWLASNGELLRVIDTGTVIESLAYSPDGTVLATGEGYFENNIHLWDTSTGVLLRTLEGHNNAVGSLAYSPDGRLLASGSYDGNVRLWGITP